MRTQHSVNGALSIACVHLHDASTPAAANEQPVLDADVERWTRRRDWAGYAFLGGTVAVLLAALALAAVGENFVPETIPEELGDWVCAQGHVIQTAIAGLCLMTTAAGVLAMRFDMLMRRAVEMAANSRQRTQVAVVPPMPASPVRLWLVQGGRKSNRAVNSMRAIAC
jgi:hypothetical protein